VCFYRDKYKWLISNDEAVSNVNSMVLVSMVNAHTKRKHKSRWRHQPIIDGHTSEVQVKLKLVNTGVENVAETQKS